MGKTYRWELRNGSKKEVCPRCGQKRFVPYVSALDHKTLAGAAYGRCDREQHCGYQCYPGREVSTEGIERVELPEETPLSFYPAAVVVSYDTPLFTWAVSVLGSEEEAKAAWDEYKVGADGRRTIFWQIAKNGEVRAGKSIPYGPDGHRDKTDKFPASWLHKSRRYDGMHEGTALRQCLYGEHLLSIYPDKEVRVVESEKTALMMSRLSSRYLWVASGGSKGLNEDKCKALRGRNVTLVPDHGQYYNWSVIAQNHGFNIDTYIELNPVFDGCDILDYFA